MSVQINFYRRAFPDILTSFESDKGKQLFKDSMENGCMESYFILGPQLRTQDEPAYCGLSSMVIILNALSVDPGIVWKGVWRWYHESILDCCAPLEEIKVKGVTMEQLACIARCNQLEAKVVHADETGLDEFRQQVLESSKSTDFAMIVSFGRQVLEQSGSGHFAPIGGYCPKEDSVLVLEPARFKYPPFWVPMQLLWKAMDTLDPSTGKKRGFMILRKVDSQPTLLFMVSKALNAHGTCSTNNRALIQSISEFIFQKVNSSMSVSTIVKEICKQLLQMSENNSIAGGHTLLITRLTKSKLRELSPEHQQAVYALVAELEGTRLYQLISEATAELSCCGQTLFDLSAENANFESCCGSCVLCAPHYMTILFFVLPVFGDQPNFESYSQSQPTLDQAFKTYLAVITALASELDSSSRNDKDAAGDTTNNGWVLLKNEVDQLKTQFLNVAIKKKSCCPVHFL